MTNLLKVSVLSLLGVLVSVSVAEAIAINRCVRIVRDQVGRETLVNTCNACVLARVERRRPGNPNNPPNLRDYTIPQGSKQPLSFRGPGKTRILSEVDCHAIPDQSLSTGG